MAANGEARLLAESLDFNGQILVRMFQNDFCSAITD